MQMTQGDIIAELQKRAQAGSPDDPEIAQLRQKLAPLTPLNPIVSGGQPIQPSTYGPNNVPQGFLGMDNPGGNKAPHIVPDAKVDMDTPQQDNSGVNINDIMRQLQPTPIQSFSNALSVLGGGKPIYDPDMPREFIKTGGAMRMAMLPYQQQHLQSQTENQNAGTGLKQAQTSYVAPQADAKIGQEKAQTNVFNAQAGSPDGEQRQPGQPLSGDYENMAQMIAKGALSADSVTARYPGLKASILQRVSEINPNFQGQTYGATEAGMKGLVKPLETQNAKVDSGLHALRVMDQNFNSQNGQFDVAKMNKGELDQNLANLISGQGPSSDARVEGIRQGSLQGTLMDKIGYLIGKPVNVLTPDIAKLLHQTLIGQIKQSDMERQPYKQQLGINKFGNDPEDYFAKSPSYQYYNGQGQNGQQQVQSQPSPLSEDDIQFTMQKHGLSRQEVLKRLGRNA